MVHLDTEVLRFTVFTGIEAHAKSQFEVASIGVPKYG